MNPKKTSPAKTYMNNKYIFGKSKADENQRNKKISYLIKNIIFYYAANTPGLSKNTGS